MGAPASTLPADAHTQTAIRSNEHLSQLHPKNIEHRTDFVGTVAPGSPLGSASVEAGGPFLDEGAHALSEVGGAARFRLERRLQIEVSFEVV